QGVVHEAGDRGQQAVHRGDGGGQVDGVDDQVVRPDREGRVGVLHPDVVGAAEQAVVELEGDVVVERVGARPGGDHLAGRVVHCHPRGDQTQPGRLEPDGASRQAERGQGGELVVIDVGGGGQVAVADQPPQETGELEGGG